ncbi:MAG: hypothetical protein IIA90_00660 [Chloroflexi bacterium]|nr:hypothetical protein [Chloroflexota bacterium]
MTRSKLVGGKFVVGENFKRDFRLLAALSARQLEVLAAFLRQDDKKSTPRRTVIELGQELDLTGGSAVQLTSVAKYLLQTKIDSDDSWPDLIGDFAELAEVESDRAAAVTEFFDGLEDVTVEFKREARRRRLLSHGGPILDEFSLTTNLRLVTEVEFKATQSVDEYSPTVAELMPVITCTIHVTDIAEEAQSITFQTDRKTAGEFIAMFQATIKEVDLLEQIAKDASQ